MVPKDWHWMSPDGTMYTLLHIKGLLELCSLLRAFALWRYSIYSRYVVFRKKLKKSKIVCLQCKVFAVVSKMVLNIDIFQGIVSKIENPVFWQHYIVDTFKYMQYWYHRKKSHHYRFGSLSIDLRSVATSTSYFLDHLSPTVSRVSPICQYVWTRLMWIISSCMCERAAPDHLRSRVSGDEISLCFSDEIVNSGPLTSLDEPSSDFSGASVHCTIDPCAVLGNYLNRYELWVGQCKNLLLA